MESFYGGRPGTSFVITKTFQTEDDMIRAFRQGNSYTQVYYDEYVIISVSPNETRANVKKQNGRVYRRGYNYTNAMGGAEFVGNIKGPAGVATNIDIVHFNQTKSPLPEGSFSAQYGQLNCNISGYADPNPANWTSDLVPGAWKDAQDRWQYKDSIAWQSFYILSPDGEQQIKKIGFQIPFPVLDFNIELIDANLAPSAERINVDENEQDISNHPFYSKWNFKIPKSIRGDSITKISLISGKDNDNVIYEDDPNDEKKNSDKASENLILVYTKVAYDSAGSPRAQEVYYLADYQTVQNIDITPQGHMRVTLPNGTVVTSQKRVIPRIVGAELSSTGQVTFTWQDTNGDQIGTTSDTEIQWIDDVNYNSDGNLEITWNTPERQANGEIQYENNEIVKKTKTLSLPSKPITNIVVINGILYQTYLGIKQEIAALASDSQPPNEETLLTYENEIYYHDLKNDIWYKQVADLSSLIKNVMTNIGVIASNEAISGENYLDISRAVKFHFAFNSANPYPWSLSADVYRPIKPWPSYLFDNSTKTVTNQQLDWLFQGIAGYNNPNSTLYPIYVACCDSDLKTLDYLNTPENNGKDIITSTIYSKLKNCKFTKRSDGTLRITYSGVNANPTEFATALQDLNIVSNQWDLVLLCNFDGTFPI